MLDNDEAGLTATYTVGEELIKSGIEVYVVRLSGKKDPDEYILAFKAYAMKENIVAVRGNCDSEVDQMLLHFPIMAPYAVVVDEGRRLFLTHGHIYNEENMPPGLHDVFFYGHTHLQKLERTPNGQVVCNTG